MPSPTVCASATTGRARDAHGDHRARSAYPSSVSHASMVVMGTGAKPFPSTPTWNMCPCGVVGVTVQQGQALIVWACFDVPFDGLRVASVGEVAGEDAVAATRACDGFRQHLPPTLVQQVAGLLLLRRRAAVNRGDGVVIAGHEELPAIERRGEADRLLTVAQCEVAEVKGRSANSMMRACPKWWSEVTKSTCSKAKVDGVTGLTPASSVMSSPRCEPRFGSPPGYSPLRFEVEPGILDVQRHRMVTDWSHRRDPAAENAADLTGHATMTCPPWAMRRLPLTSFLPAPGGRGTSSARLARASPSTTSVLG